MASGHTRRFKNQTKVPQRNSNYKNYILFRYLSIKCITCNFRCDTIHLESCGVAGGFAPNWRDYLVISPMWTFKKSWVYCGKATTVSAIVHTSLCDKMAISFRSNDNEKRYKGFHCTYTIID